MDASYYIFAVSLIFACLMWFCFKLITSFASDRIEQYIN